MSATPGRLPDAVIAGVPKAGTSALARWLAERDDVYLPADKEVHFFDEHRREGLDWYAAQFADAGGARVVLDATPTYVLREDWFADLRATLPQARLVVILRHPVDRLWSAYWYLRSMGQEPRSVERAVAEELDGTTHYPWAHVDTGDYRPVLDRLDRIQLPVPPLVLLHEDLRADPAATFDRACEHLGLETGRPPSVGGEVNVTGTLRSFAVRHWSMRLHLFRRAPRLAHALDRWNRTDRRPPPLPTELRARLLEHYEPSVAAVEQRLDRDLSAWRR
jgi:hypothetical protein